MSSNKNYDLTRFSEKDRELIKLLVKISDNKQSALNEFYDLTSGLVFSLSMKMLSVKEEAEELVMDIYTYVWKNANKYNPERSAPITWLLLITRSRCIDSIRSNSKRFTTEFLKDDDFLSRVESSERSPEQVSGQAEKRKVINKALSTLSDNQRRTIELAYFYGYTQSEIANELGHPLGTIKSWARLGMFKLRDVVKNSET